MTAVTGIAILGILGAIFALVLALAQKFWAVHDDARLGRVEQLLGGANCGACGFASCHLFAEALVSGKAGNSICPVLSNSAQKEIDSILGRSTEAIAKPVAVIACGGSTNVARSIAEYHGISDCKAASLIMSGSKECEYGCLGLGTCVSACPFGALTMGKNGLPVVDEEKCTGCGKCVDACPRGVIKLIDRRQQVYVACNSPLKGKEVRQACKAGCYTCGVCASPKISPAGAVRYENNLPVIDIELSGKIEMAVRKCPAKCLIARGKLGKKIKSQENHVEASLTQQQSNLLAL